MNLTQKQDNHGPDKPSRLKDIVARVTRAWIASATRPVTVPAEADSAGYDLTDAGRAALTQPDLKSMTQQEFCRWANPAADAEEPVAFVAVRGWCERCGQALPVVCTWDEPLCSDCVIVVPADNPYGYIVTGRGSAPSTVPVDVVTETDDETTARVLREAAAYLERHGWIQGAYYDATAGNFTPPACLVGAIGVVCYGGPVDAPAQHFGNPGFLDFEAAVLHLDRYLLVEDSSESYEFNDARGRCVEDVTRVLRDAAVRPAHELIDALRVIEAHNADMAALAQMLSPSGVFANEVERPETVAATIYGGACCPSCKSTDRAWRAVVDDGDGFGFCDHDWHDGDSEGGDA